MLMLTVSQREELLRALTERDRQYDPDVRLLRVPLKGPGYHTTLSDGTLVHPTRESAAYAVALLDSGEEWRRERALEVLDTLLSLQDQDPGSRTYGIWSWYQDEPLARMSPPDWNWADFLGVQLLQVALDHRDRLPADLAERLEAAIEHACRSIIRRNVGMDYTNIAIMGTYVTYVAGETYAWSDILEYAGARLRRFYDFTLEEGGFPEYNSPTYSVVAITELTRMLAHVRNPEARRLVQEIHDRAWKDVAAHFHPPTRQWAGPHSRCYSTLLRPDTLAFLQRALGDAARLTDVPLPPSLDAHRVPASCPVESRAAFTTLPGTLHHVQVLRPGSPPTVGTTHLAPVFTIASVNCGMFWNQCRPLVAYWNGPAGPAALQVRFLHDGYDYSSAHILCAQQGSEILAGVCFATDGGDTHPSLDRVRNATIEAEDLRLRLEFFSMPEEWPLPRWTLGETTALDLGEVHLAVRPVHAAFGEWKPTAEVSREGARVFLDVVLTHGARRSFCFTEIAPAFLILGLSLRAADEAMCPPDAITWEEDGDEVTARWGGSLAVRFPGRPVTGGEIWRQASAPV